MRSGTPVGTIAVEATVVAVVILLIAGACRSGFVPSTPPTPLMTGQGETHVAGYFGNHGFAGHLGYSPFQGIELIAGGAYNSERDGGLEVSHHQGEGVIGYYPTPTGDFRLDILAGFGGGTFHDFLPGLVSSTPLSERGPGEWRQFSGSARRYMLQANFGWADVIHNSPYGLGPIQSEMGGSLRLMLADFRSLTSVDSITAEQPRGSGSTRYPDQRALFVEPTFFGRVGTEHLMFEGQVGFSFTTTHTDVSWDVLHIAFGFHLLFGRRFSW